MENLPQFNIVDLVVLGLVVLGFLRGLSRGLSGELSGLISAAVAVAAGVLCYRPIGDRFVIHGGLSDTEAHLLAFGMTVLGVYLLMRILRVIFRNIMEFTFKGKLEKIGGALFGMVRTMVIMALLLLILGLWPNDKLQRLCARKSFFGHIVQTQLAPLYQNLAERYPILKVPGRETPPTGAETEDVEAPPPEEPLPGEEPQTP